MYSATQMAAVILRRGSVADAAELAAFAARTFEETYSANNRPDDMQAHLAATYGPSQQAAELADPLVATILARSNGELVAYAQVRRNPPPPCVTHAAPIELHRFYVDRRAHGAGLAPRLMQAVHQTAREFQGRHIWLSVWERNPRAIAFYKKAMFVDVGSTFYMVGPDKQMDRVLVAVVPAQDLGAT
ncbi:MAG: GNAT family N-acetyltransferase [Woeseiaceae bacterium]|jgi:GNAT superfamily N-acetyltransferase